MRFRIPLDRVSWVTSSFLMGTLVLTLTAVPWYLWTFGLSWFQAGMFLAFYILTGISITLGYHRLFSHLAFRAKWPIRLVTLVFGAAAFENSALEWCSDHRRHHKHVDQEEDPYDISKGLFWAHIGWLMFKLGAPQPMDNVNDLRRDRLVMWQNRWCHLIGVLVGFGLPALLGYAVEGAAGALGGFLLAGVARVVAVQHSTFCINSLCHSFGRRPYSSKVSARDSFLMALVTFGEGYHNFHHEFQHDYRNGVKPWQWDPTKWTIWTLSKLGLVRDLRRVPAERILAAELVELKHRIDAGLEGWDRWVAELPESSRVWADQALLRVREARDQAEQRIHALQAAATQRAQLSADLIAQWRRDLREVRDQLEAFHRQALPA